MTELKAVSLKEVSQGIAKSVKPVSILWQAPDTIAFVARGRVGRSEFHSDPSDEVMYMIKGDMNLHYIDAAGVEKVAVIREGEIIYGVGAVSAAKLAADGYRLIADLQRAEEHDLIRRYGEEGARLWRLARGIDTRDVNPERDTKSISAETTFERDIGEFRPLEQHLWELTDRVSARL